MATEPDENGFKTRSERREYVVRMLDRLRDKKSLSRSEKAMLRSVAGAEGMSIMVESAISNHLME